VLEPGTLLHHITIILGQSDTTRTARSPVRLETYRPRTLGMEICLDAEQPGRCICVHSRHTRRIRDILRGGGAFGIHHFGQAQDVPDGHPIPVLLMGSQYKRLWRLRGSLGIDWFG
jgi:hypothetical protein